MWFLLSGHYSLILIIFGLISVFFILLCTKRLGIIDKESLPIALIPGLLKYSPWLLGQIIQSGIKVSIRIISPKLPINPSVIRVQVVQDQVMTKVAFANSITLTPGTVSLELTDKYIEVHALSKEDSDTLLNGKMSNNISKIEASK